MRLSDDFLLILIKHASFGIFSDRHNHHCLIVHNMYILNELKCGHKYHNTCIDDWIKNNNNCPLCRLSI